MQSSPSPTSIITSINQSNYLCSQAPDSQTNSQNNEIFQRPSKNANRTETKQPQFKEIVIVEATKSEVDQQTRDYVPNAPRPNKQDNYDFKNLAINNYIQAYSNSQDIFPNQQNRNEMFPHTLKIDNFNFEKPKFFLSSYTENGVRVTPANARADAPQTFVPGPIRYEEGKDKMKTGKTQHTTVSFKDSEQNK